MSYRFMRVIVFFDLPSVTYTDKKDYTQFRRFLLQNGFIMMQESVYTKLALNQTVADGVIKLVKTNKPDEGIVQMLCVTEKQFSKIEYVVGQKKTNTIDTDERLVVL